MIENIQTVVPVSIPQCGAPDSPSSIHFNWLEEHAHLLLLVFSHSGLLPQLFWGTVKNKGICFKLNEYIKYSILHIANYIY